MGVSAHPMVEALLLPQQLGCLHSEAPIQLVPRRREFDWFKPQAGWGGTQVGGNSPTQLRASALTVTPT